MIFVYFATFAALILSYLFLNRKASTRFSTSKRHWFVAGISLFAVQVSITTPMLFSGVFHDTGAHGMWFVWSKYLIAGMVPFVFAPLWIKLKIKTDNEFAIKRFSGPSAVYLQVFRAIYVGFFICCLVLSFQVLAFIKFLAVISDWDRNSLFALVGFTAIVLSFFNRLRSNLITEYGQAILLLGLMAALLISIHIEVDLSQSIQQLKESEPETLRLIPSLDLSFLIYVLAHAFFIHLFDGGGVESQRFFANRSPKNVWKVAVTSGLLVMLFNFFIYLILIAGKATFPNTTVRDGEMKLIEYLQAFSEPPMMALVVVLFSALFLSSFIGLLNWGASYLSVDIYNRYIQPNGWVRKSTFSQWVLVGISGLSITIAFYAEALDYILKIIFNLTAGVAPVFVLRWFWMRINAWSQISAMVGGLIYAALYFLLLEGSDWETTWRTYFSCSAYSLRIYTLTILTTATWLLVTFLTPKDDPAVLHQFKSEVLADFNPIRSIRNAVLYGGLVIGLFFLLFGLLIHAQ